MIYKRITVYKTSALTGPIEYTFENTFGDCTYNNGALIITTESKNPARMISQDIYAPGTWSKCSTEWFYD